MLLNWENGSNGIIHKQCAPQGVPKLKISYILCFNLITFEILEKKRTNQSNVHKLIEYHTKIFFDFTTNFNSAQNNTFESNYNFEYIGFRVKLT